MHYINVIRLCSELHRHNEALLKDGDDFIEEINNLLFNDDVTLVEGATDPLCNVIFVESGGAETEFLKIYKSLPEPIYIISNCKNNSLPAALEIKTFCESVKHLETRFYPGNEEEIARGMRGIVSSEVAYQSLKDNNLGVIGKPSDWLIASKVSPKVVKEKYNINLIDISLDELYTEIDKKELVKVPHLATLNKKAKDLGVLAQALYIYSALIRLVNKYNLKGLTIRCFDMLSRYKNTACLALALLNEQGITATCEGDVPTLLTMHFLRAITGLPSFQANPSKIDYANNQILFAHCTLPLNMASKYSLTTHFESGLGIGIRGEMPAGNVTICKIPPSLKVDEVVALEGTIKSCPNLPNYCRTQIEVELKNGGVIFPIRENFGNHVVITYADCMVDFLTLLYMYEVRNKPKRKIKKVKEEVEE